MHATLQGFFSVAVAAAISAAGIPTAFGQVTIVSETFDGYSSDAEMRTVWVPTVGNGTAVANFVDDASSILTTDDVLFPGIQGQALDHIGAIASSPGMVNQYGGVIDQLNGLQPGFQVNPSPTQSVFVSVDIYESGSGNERMSLGLRYIDTAGGSVVTQNILELGFSNAVATDPTGGADPTFFPGPGYGYRVILFGGVGSPLTAQPNNQFFQLPIELDRPTDADTVTNIGDVGAGWHQFSALIEPEQITLSIDLWRDGLRNTSRTPDAETGIRPGEPGIDSTVTWPVSITENGFNSLRLGGPSGVTSIGLGAMAFDNVMLQLVDAAAPSTDIVIDVASGSQTQAQAGYASISTATSVTKTGVGTVVFDAANAYTGPTTISAGTLELTNPDGLGFTTVTVDTGATLAVASGTTMKSPAVIVDGGVISGGALAVNSSTGIASLAINAGSIAGSPTVTIADGGQMALVQDARVSVSIGGLSVDQGTGGGRLDVGGGQVTVGAGGITAEDLRADIIAGRNGGAWNGTTGITSSAAAAAGGTRAVGYVVAGDGSARMSFSAPGDTNINGQVDVFDLVAVNSGGKYGTGTAAVWSEGDFNYDGVTNVFDLVSTNSAGAYGQGDYFPAAPTAVGSVAAVPEPATFLSLAVAGLAAGLVVSRRLHWRSLA